VSTPHGTYLLSIMAELGTPINKSFTSEISKVGREYLITDCQTETVVVFLDRAEVTRSLVCKVTKGENEIIVKNLSKWVDTDSIR